MCGENSHYLHIIPLTHTSLKTLWIGPEMYHIQLPGEHTANAADLAQIPTRYIAISSYQVLIYS